MLTPERGSVLQRFGDLAIQALDVSAREAVEVTRNYPARAFAVQKDSSRALPQHALGDELRVPVRSFTVEVVNTLPCHEALAMPLVERTETRPGSEVFVLVPVRIVSASPPMTAVYTPPAPAGTRDPAPSVSVVTDVPEALRERVRDGGVFRIGFEASDPPEEEVALTWQISVRGRARNAAGTEQDISSNLTVSIRLRPHFRLALPAAGNTVARGAAIRLSCTDGAPPGQVTVTPSAGTTVTTSGANIDIAVDAAAATGPRTVLVERQGTPAEQARRTIVVT
jgi:hypothetical protein